MTRRDLKHGTLLQARKRLASKAIETEMIKIGRFVALACSIAVTDVCKIIERDTLAVVADLDAEPPDVDLQATDQSSISDGSSTVQPPHTQQPDTSQVLQ
eukprot:m.48207 g.48207  ORF g.48207 m.48207 type:complete len:100 (-) comp6407_c1_seq2:385-684(-)